MTALHNEMNFQESIPTPAVSQFLGESSKISGMVGEMSLGSQVDVQGTPRKSLSQAFGVNHISHLPTPDSPGNLSSYIPALTFASGSPLPLGQPSTSTHTYSSAPEPINTFLEESIPGSDHISRHLPRPEDLSSFMTPESSPVFSRKVMPLDEDMVAVSSVSLLSSPFTPHASSRASSQKPATSASDPHATLSRESSRLSSPFLERLSLNQRSKATSPLRSRAATPPNGPGDVMAVEMQEVPAQALLPLTAPIPQRAVGGEIQRLRLQMAADQAARLSELEARRPDYLVREKRPRSAADTLDVNADESDEVVPGLGVTASPVKGRRIKLFQETSEESFEQSLLAGGYPGYGSTPAAEPQTPANTTRTSFLSQRALQWLQQATPGQPGPSTMTSEPDADWVPSEQEIKKRKRLAAFEESRSRYTTPAKLHPVEIEGKGRVLLNVPPEEVPPQFESPTKKRNVSKRKRRGGHAHAARRGGAQQQEDGEVQRPNWLDSVFPWCMRAQERAEMERMEREERLKRIERYMERDSDSDESDIVEDQTLQPAVHSDDEDEDDNPPRPRRGRGKMIPLLANPDKRQSRNQDKGSTRIPIDPADARAALLSKRSVRALAFRRKQERMDDDEDSFDEEVNCKCGRGDDGRPLVQCDECNTWYHLVCVGVRSAAELGAEEDPWYCEECLGPIRTPDPPSEPTFVPTDDRMPVGGRRDPLFYQGSFIESPSMPWGVSRGDPATPIRGRDLGHTLSSRSSWGDSTGHGPKTPNSTTHTARVYTTPGPFENTEQFESPPFDPTKTPSRLSKGGAAFVTPKNGLWPHYTPGVPGSVWKSGGAINFAHSDRPSAFGSSFRSIYSLDDTPIRRAETNEPPRGPLVGRKLWTSPDASSRSLQEIRRNAESDDQA